MKELEFCGLFKGIGNIDDSLLTEALCVANADDMQRAKKKTSTSAQRRRVRLVVSIAACFVLLAAIIPFAFFLKEKGRPGADGYANATLSVGAWYVCNDSDSPYFCTNIYYSSCVDNKITVFLEKADDTEILWHLEGYYVEGSREDENGKTVYDLVKYYATTDKNYLGEGTLVEDGIVFTVNGEVGAEFPTASGEYEIVIDYSRLAEMCTELNPYLVSDYAAFYIGKDKTLQK